MNEQLTQSKAIRAKCIDCCGGSKHEVRLCTSQNCPLHFYRFGENPNRKGIGNKKAVPPKAK